MVRPRKDSTKHHCVAVKSGVCIMIDVTFYPRKCNLRYAPHNVLLLNALWAFRSACNLFRAQETNAPRARRAHASCIGLVFFFRLRGYILYLSIWYVMGYCCNLLRNLPPEKVTRGYIVDFKRLARNIHLLLLLTRHQPPNHSCRSPRSARSGQPTQHKGVEMPTKPETINLARAPKTKRLDTPELAEAARIRSTRRWQRLRNMHRRRFPLCCNPFDYPSHEQPSQHVHHIEPLGRRPDLAFELGNLAPLCAACHAQIEAMERQGRPTRQLFPRGGGGIQSPGA